jgi:DNA-binding FadR family transcriptional regulator
VGDPVRFQYRTILVPGRAERSYAEHTAIVDAIAAGEADAAEAAMRGHLLHVTDALRAARV